MTDPTSLTSATAGIWVVQGFVPLTTNWSIGTSAFASDIGAGVASLTNTFFGPGGIAGYDIYSSSFTLSGDVVPDTTYWLTLTGTTVTGGDFAYWDLNNGPSSAFQSSIGPIASESFQLFGTVPEPTSAAVLALIAATCAGYLRRR